MNELNLLPKNHISLTASHQVKSICAPLFDRTEISYFHYAHVKNNHISMLLSQIDWHHYYWENLNTLLNQHEKYCDTILSKYSKSWILSMKEPEAASAAAQYFHLKDFMQFFVKTDQGYEEFAFATKNGASIINFCINNQDLLHQFCLYFKEQAHPLLHVAKKEAIDFSSVIAPFPKDHITTHNKLDFQITNYPFKYLNQTHTLTPQETKCLKLLGKGYSYKTIARTLDLSPRTVEYHLNNIKKKTNITTSQRLIEAFHQSDLFHIKAP